MKIEIWGIGKTKSTYLIEGEREYEKRLKHYISVSQRIFEPIKGAANLSPQDIKKKEADMLLQALKPEDHLLLLDEYGKQYDSLAFADQIQSFMNQGHRRVVFIIGGAWGFDDSIKNKAAELLSLSKMTFTHQMIRLIFLEQIYRAMTILRNEPYHNT